MKTGGNSQPLVSSLWRSESSSFLSDASLGKQSEPEDANVSDDNADEEDMYESNHLVFERPAQGLNSHLEGGPGAHFRFKNSFQSFQEQKGSERKASDFPRLTSPLEVLPPGSGHFCSFDDYQDSEQMARDLLKLHNIEKKMADLTLIEQIHGTLQGKLDASPKLRKQ